MNYYLSLAALVPVVLLFIRVYQLDRIEKEPRVLLGKLIGLGALAAVPAALVEVGLLHLLGRAAPRASAAYLLVQNFLIVAGSEELGKFLPVRLAAWRDPAFDYRFDAVVYAVSSSLGFAAVENVLYVMQSDLRTAVSRAILSVPGHFFFAVCMGLFLSRAKQAESCGQLRCSRWMQAAAVLAPMALHGFWDFCLAVAAPWAAALFYVFVALFFIIADYHLRKASQTDGKL